MTLFFSFLFFLTFNIIVVQYSVAATTNDTSVPSEGEDIEFESTFVKLPAGQKVDLSRFASGTNVLPGIYKVGVTLNKHLLTVAEIEFKATDSKKVTPCIPVTVLNLIDFKKEQISFNQWDTLTADAQCIDMKKIVPEATLEFDNQAQQLNISVPQIMINNLPRGSVPSSMWDSGIPALMLSYNMNAYQSQSSGYESKTYYSSINSGLNIGSWYLRHNGSYNWAEGTGGRYTVLNTFLQHDLPQISGRMLAGQSYTSGQLFDTVPITGLQVASDERMLPQSQRGYAPEIRGVAKTNAKVTVKQGGATIYETTVSPGAFVINDLYPTGYGGNLDVTIEEADGSQQNFSMPYAAVSQLLRPGSQRYSISLGQLRNDSVSDDPSLIEATYQRGFTNMITGYGGVQANQDYQAIKLGMALGLPVGALAFDVTQSEARLPSPQQEKLSGQSYELSYSKLINETNSNITLAAYRFSSSGYMDYMTAMESIQAIHDGEDRNTIQRQKNRFTVTISQGLPEEWGQIYLSGSLEDYWDQDNLNRQYQFGYSNRYKQLNYSINVSRSQDAWGESQTSFYLNLSFPLWESHSSNYVPQMSLSYSQDTRGGSNEQAMISGSAGATNQYSWNVSGSHDSNTASSGSVGGSYRGGIAQLSGSYSKGADYHSTSLGMSGSLVAHSGGITASPYTGDTFTLVEAKGAEGATIPSYPGISVDRFGYALLPATNPYQMSDVIIDPKGTSHNVELDSTSQKIVPRYGAVVKVGFNADRGTPILITSTLNGQPLPFGADVFDEHDHSVGIVAQGGVIYARVADQKGTLRVKWGDDISASCSVSYMLALTESEDQPSEHTIQRFNKTCTQL
ncbi:pilus assembly protein PapC [Citrobacter freundii complex sp. CFNIH2]|nr:pilus assembly protein PapC [Citrobacter freundii complex sp. CFNIH2]